MKIYRFTEIEGLGYEPFNTTSIYESGSTAGQESGMTDGYESGHTEGYEDGYAEAIALCSPLCWLEDLEGNVIQRDVITLSETGGTVSFKVVCTSDDVVWSFGDGVVFQETGTGTTTYFQDFSFSTTPEADFYTWQSLSSSDATVLPGSALRLTVENLTPSVNFYLSLGSSTYSSGDSVTITSANTNSLYANVIANTAYTITCEELTTGECDLTISSTVLPLYGTGGHISYMPINNFPESGPRTYVFRAFITGQTEPVSKITVYYIE